MEANIILIIIMLLACVAALVFACRGMFSNVKTARNVDINKYMGTWHEIARLDTSFQRGKYNSQAFYKLNRDGTVFIINSATDKNGRKVSASARGYAPDPKDFSKLRISFFRPFYANYFILELDEDYQWALVGGNGKKYLWILSRIPQMDAETLNKIINLAKERNYDVSKLLFNKDLIPK
ncbi:lipocalin family protein [Intestinicryptomonas porci]|uniref:Lipocalin family protein n=1 Tax=Intestinicryptomonas porci TaxID=2926320 RepID=A0ABU4WIN4_9BACT|nr:lipocalin family protein [Opitutales bacterium CLA-KB-P66]